MKQQENASTKAVGSGSGSGAILPTEFVQTVKTEMKWDVSTKDGIKQTSLALSKILSSDDSPTAIPTNIDLSKVRMEVGKIILQNKEKSMEEILELITQKYCLKERKEKEN
jgi:hypothetical protein